MDPLFQIYGSRKDTFISKYGFLLVILVTILITVVSAVILKFVASNPTISEFPWWGISLLIGFSVIDAICLTKLFGEVKKINTSRTIAST